MGQKLYLFVLIRGVADMIEQVSMTVDVDLGNDQSKGLEDLVLLIA